MHRNLLTLGLITALTLGFFVHGCADDDTTDPDGYTPSAGATISDHITVQAFTGVAQSHVDALRDGLTHVASLYPISTRLHVVLFMTESYGANTIADNLCQTLYAGSACARRADFVENVHGSAEHGQQATRFLDGKAVVYFRIGPDEENANLLRAVSMHEYFHIYQDEHSQKAGNPDLPGWFDEGTASYIGWSLGDARGWTNADHDEWETLSAKLASHRRQVASEDLELTPTYGEDGLYALGALAIDYLLTERAVPPATLFTQIARDTKEAGFDAAFEMNIGLSLPDFVDAFNSSLEDTSP